MIVTIQEENGGLRTLLNPLDDLTLTRTANEDAWDMLIPPVELQSRRGPPGPANSNE